MNTIDWVKFVLKEVMWDKSLRYFNFVKVASIQNYFKQNHRIFFHIIYK